MQQKSWARVFIFFLVSVYSYASWGQSDVVATLFGEQVTESSISPDKKQLNQFARGNSISKDMAIMQFRHAAFADKVVEAVFKDFAKQNNIKPDKELVNAFIKKFATELAQSSVSPEKSVNEIADEQVLRWMIDRALYKKYGGTVIFRQSNPQQPVSAYEKVLKEYQEQGLLAINSEQYSAVFWEAFEPPFNFVIAPENVNFDQPWWLDTP